MRQSFQKVGHSGLTVFFAIWLSSIVQAEEVNPNFVYLHQGELTGYRSISVGDPGNWSSQLPGREGKSASGKVSVAPADFRGTGDAIEISWDPRKKMAGNIGIYGEAMDLSAYRDQASITLDMRVDTRPDKEVRLGLDCGYPCRADIPLNSILRKSPRGEWFSLPIPLNCFEGENFDLSKISGIFSMSTDGRFKVTIANIHLERLPEGEKGCAKGE